MIRSDARDLLRQFEQPVHFPSSQDAINEYQNAINHIAIEIAAEYQRVNQQEE
jgi:hypothetical protein